MSQLITMTLNSGTWRYFRWPYHAKVMKMLETVSSSIVVIIAMLPRIKFWREDDYQRCAIARVSRSEVLSVVLADHFTSIVRSAVFVLPFPSSAVNVYFVVFFGEICMQRLTDGQTSPTGGSTLTDFAFDTP